MNPGRRHLLKTLPVAASAALACPSAQAKSQTGSATLSLEPSPVAPFRPLEQATLHIAGAGSEYRTVVLLDGAGHEYLRAKAADKLPFTIGGALGRQVARLLDEHGAIAAELEFAVDCSTELNDEGGVYRGPDGSRPVDDDELESTTTRSRPSTKTIASTSSSPTGSSITPSS